VDDKRRQQNRHIGLNPADPYKPQLSFNSNNVVRQPNKMIGQPNKMIGQPNKMIGQNKNVVEKKKNKPRAP
jgi:hypothetical protein